MRKCIHFAVSVKTKIKMHLKDLHINKTMSYVGIIEYCRHDLCVLKTK